MFKKLAGLAIVASLFFAGAAFAQTGNMSGTGHDFGDSAGFSGDSWKSSNGLRTCNVCHTTHTGDMSIAGVPLWDHELTTATFQTYVGVNMFNTASATPSGATQLCLSCHDGTLGLDSFGANGRTSTATALNGTSSAFIGTDLRDDHPVSVVYGGVSAGLFATIGNPAVTAPGGSVECSSCHEPHNSAGVDNMLVLDPAGSALCNACHNK
jgi:predicted CXXCH cytochrome family protein